MGTLECAVGDRAERVQVKRYKQDTMHRVVRRMQYMKVGQAWRAWVAKAQGSKEKQRKVYKAAVLFMKFQLGKAFRTWVDYVNWKQQKRSIVQRCVSCSPRSRVY